MAFFLFVDESGQDHRDSPCEVLAGVAVEDRLLWSLIQEVQAMEVRCFGRPFSSEAHEVKGRALLHRRVFKQAAQGEPFAPDQRAELARELLEDPQNPTRMRMTALAQAKLAFVQEVLAICARFRCKAFASLVRADAPRVDSREHLRKDYVTLFQNLHYFLEGTNPLAQGVVVFDELEKSQSHLLINQMDRYFKRSPYGQSQAELIVPEPFFVHSDLTTGIRLADFLAYILSWGFRTTAMTEPRRAELLPFVEQACALRHRATREFNGTMAVHWSFAVLQDLRPRDQQTGA